MNGYNEGEYMMLTIGNKVPAFSLPANGGQTITEKDLLGKNTILYFYPKDNTPGCTSEAKDFSALKEEFAKINTQIIGVSADNVVSHERFIEKQDLNIQLISDEDKNLIEAFGAWGEKKNYGKVYLGLIRSTFLINTQGEIIAEWRNVKAKGHAERILKETNALLT